jgi:hypothetical protein
MSGDDDRRNSGVDLIENTFDGGVEVTLDPAAEIGAVFDDLESLLKNGDVIGALSGKGVNASLALLAVDGLRHYLAGRKAEAAEDLGTVAEEIKGRLAARPEGESE